MELKFRAWHKSSERYYEVKSLILHHGNVEISRGYTFLYEIIPMEDVIIEQYTGLKNITGEMIIGDIIKTVYGNYYVSTYRGTLVFRNKHHIVLFDVDDINYEDTKTIGSVNENKELLNE